VFSRFGLRSGDALSSRQDTCSHRSLAGSAPCTRAANTRRSAPRSPPIPERASTRCSNYAARHPARSFLKLSHEWPERGISTHSEHCTPRLNCADTGHSPGCYQRPAKFRSVSSKTLDHPRVGPMLLLWSTPRRGATFCRERYQIGIRPVFQGSAKMITVDDAGEVLQNLTAAPDITPTYCLPLIA
jgi:hypothetical protein